MLGQEQRLDFVDFLILRIKPCYRGVAEMCIGSIAIWLWYQRAQMRFRLLARRWRSGHYLGTRRFRIKVGDLRRRRHQRNIYRQRRQRCMVSLIILKRRRGQHFTVTEVGSDRRIDCSGLHATTNRPWNLLDGGGAFESKAIRLHAL